MRGLLHNVRQFLGEDPGGGILSIDLPIRLRAFPRPGDQHPEIRSHPRVYDPDVRTDHGDTFDHRVVDEDGGRLFLSCDYDSVGC